MPPVASTPALQTVHTVEPGGISAAPSSPIRSHIARSSSQIAVASAISAPRRSSPAAQARSARRSIRFSAQCKFTAVGLVAPKIWHAPRIWSSTACPAAPPPRGPLPPCPTTTPIAAAIPINGAPRTRSARIASATASTVSRSR
jgi:hypothetical protein